MSALAVVAGGAFCSAFRAALHACRIFGSRIVDAGIVWPDDRRQGYAPTRD